MYKAKKKIMFVSCNPTDPVWNSPTQNFLLTQGEKKRGKTYFWFMWINFKPNWQLQIMYKLILQGKYIKI